MQEAYDRLASLSTRPWVLLSAAAGPADFQRSLTYAFRAGASGYLCGRAIWQGAFERFPDLREMERVLSTESVRYVQSINALADKLAVPWTSHRAWGGEAGMVGDGPDFAAGYRPA